MTASKTPRLSLMSPVGSDAFVVGDFSDTFGKLDAQPGVLPVPNAAGRPSSWTTAQHGSLVWQSDLGILLAWNQPNSSVVGQWQRVSGQGFLAQFVNSGSVSTSTRNYANGPVVVSGNVTVPGGRPILIQVSWDGITNDQGRNVLSYWENNNRIWDKTFYGYTGDISTGDFWFYRNPAPSAAATISVQLTIAAYNASYPNGGGTTTLTNTVMNVIEV